MQKTPDYGYLKELLSGRLKENRYLHSLAVADEAERLAKKYMADTQKAYLAGLLHDITKNAPKEEHLNIFNTFGIILNNVEKSAFKLWHAISGAAYVKYILGIDDPQIFDAIRYHTTAKPGMSLLSKIVYIADFTSADRDYDDVEVIRSLADDSLNKAFLYSLEYTIKDLVGSGRAVHIDTISAYNETVLGKQMEE